MPDMGMYPVSRKRDSAQASPTRRSVADALFSSTQKRVLALLFGQPMRSFFANEIIDRVRAGSGAVQRELRKLAESGLVTVSWVGKQKHFQANPDSPIFHELCSLIRKTVGLTEPLKQALEPHRKKIELALVYGSVAKRTETAASDVDLLVVSDALSLEEVYRAVANAEEELGRSVNLTLYTTQEFSQRRRSGNPFLKRVLGGETIVLLGALSDEAE
jgi:predicted nucleotidyltransferase